MTKNEKGQQAKSAFSQMEEDVLGFWENAGTFKKSVNKEAPQGDYVFYDGPPFGTGEPHYGHILSSVSKDVVPRYWTMRGYRVERRWGWDCHGLPIENIIEEQMKISGKKEIEKIGIDKFNEACRSQVLRYADIWDKMVRRIGRWVEFKNSYKTMDASFMESVWWAFKELWKKDLIYQGRKVLLYCPRCETPISNFEVAMDNSYKDITETSVYVKFRVTNLNEFKTNIANDVGDGNVFILAWTTTPWTLPGNVALAVGRDIDYRMVESEGEYFIFANEMLPEIKEGSGKEFKMITKIKGEELVGLEYEPLFDVPALKNSGKKAYYVAAADFVTTEDGTGVVHTAVVYGEDDYNLGLKLDLPVIPALDEKGYFNDTVPQFKGVYFKKADKLIIDDLEKRGLLFKKEQTKHSYPFCHRCDTQLFYNAIPAWFLSIEKIRKDLIKQNENINWFPKHLKHGRFKQGLEQAPDWNISRNRYFATPMPIWECERCRAREVIGSIAELKEKTGEKEIKDIHSHFIDKLTWDCQCGGKTKRIEEVFDCWLESGSMSFAQHHYPFENKEKFEKNFPAQFISEYISQTRAWFYVMHVISVALFGKNSFENCATNGVILNEKGEKMSKSKKNYPDPWKVIDEFGVDALRFYMMSSSLMHAENLFFNERELRDVFRKNVMLLWNVYKFYEMFANTAISNPSPASKVAGKGSDNILDRWILARLNQLIKIVTEGMDNYDMPRATRPITEFINDLSTWYIRRSRDRFKGEDEADKQAAIKSAGLVLLELSKVIAPFMPFMAEQIWQRVTGNDFKDEDKSVHLESWPLAVNSKQKTENSILAQMSKTRGYVEMILSSRDKYKLKIRQPLNSVIIAGKLEDEYKKLISEECNIHNVISPPFDQPKSKNWKFDEKKEIFLDIKITDELKLEGIKREIVRFINDMRKKASLTIKDRVAVYWRSESEMIRAAIKKYSHDIIKETLADEIEESAEANKKIKINNSEIGIEIKKK